MIHVNIEAELCYSWHVPKNPISGSRLLIENNSVAWIVYVLQFSTLMDEFYGMWKKIVRTVLKIKSYVQVMEGEYVVSSYVLRQMLLFPPRENTFYTVLIAKNWIGLCLLPIPNNLIKVFINKNIVYNYWYYLKEILCQMTLNFRQNDNLKLVPVCEVNGSLPVINRPYYRLM